MRKAYLGVDIGSISTKAVIIDEENNILLSEYIWTEGNPIEAVKKIMQSFKEKIEKDVKIVGVGTTGSARKLIGTILGANIIKNERMSKSEKEKHYNISCHRNGKTT